MRNITKKMMISILTTIFVLITVVATTYAWVGIFTYSSSGNFDLNLEVEDLSKDYYLTISDTGIKGTYSDHVPLDQLQIEIMNNMNVDYSKYIDPTNASAVNEYFNKKISLQSVTPEYNKQTNEIEKFYEIENLIMQQAFFVESNQFFKFDIYLSVDTREGIQSTTNVNANVALKEIENSLVGILTSYNLQNGNTLLLTPSYDSTKYPILNDIPTTFTINSASSSRFSLSIYKPIDIEQEYTNEKPLKTVFYQGGTALPTLENGVYSLGGILPEEYNLAVQEINRMFNENLKVDTEALEREELELIDENRFLWLASENENDPYLGVKNGVQTKMKITVHFWFEGWDADCISAISMTNVILNLKFTADIEDEE